jgi:thiol:disulfide interchange protein
MRLAGLLLLLAVAVAGPAAASDQSSGFEPAVWLQGADGLFGAIESLKKERAASPMVVYFYTDWCGYCRQFERELLGTEPVKKYFGDVLAVRINPESRATRRSSCTAGSRRPCRASSGCASRTGSLA